MACEIRWNEVFDESSYYILQVYFIAPSIKELHIPFALIAILYSIILFKLKTQKVAGVQSAVNNENLRAGKKAKKGVKDGHYYCFTDCNMLVAYQCFNSSFDLRVGPH